MFRDFFFVHADVLRNVFVLLVFTGGTVLLTLLVSRWTYRKKAITEASVYLKQSIAEARIERDAVKEVNAALLATIERLTHVQNTATAAARSVVEEVAKAKEA
jgi:hypothetical protein